MPYITPNYQLNALKAGDIWYPDIDQNNMQIIENLMQSAEYFVGNGILNLGTCQILSSAPTFLKQRLYNAAFDYYNDLFFNAENYDLHFISNEDVVVDLVAKSNINLITLFQQTINGAGIKPGYKIFLTSQTISSQNGVYQVSITGASKLNTQPNKVFINVNDPVYQYSIFLYNDSSKTYINTYDCLIVVDSLIAIQNSRAVTSPNTCYIRATSGNNTLTAYSPGQFYGSGTPILFITNLANDPAVVLASFSASGSSFNNYSVVQNLNISSTGSYLINFNSQTINQQPSYKPLHIHNNQKGKLGLSNFIKLVLTPKNSFSNACEPYDVSGNSYIFSPTTQKIESVYLNEKSLDLNLVNYSSSTRTFNFAFPVASSDDIYCVVSQSNIVTLSPLVSLNSSSETYTLANSGNAVAYTWENTTFDNYNLYVNGKNISQQSFNVDNNTGIVTINQPNNVSDLPSDPNVFSNSSLELSSTTNDQSSFFGLTNKIDTLNPSKITGNLSSYRAKHNQFDTQLSNTGYVLCPFRAIGNNIYQIPYYNGTSFNNVQPVSPISDAVFSSNFAVVNIDGFLFVLLNQQLKSILSEYSDKNYTATIVKRIQNTEDSFIILFNNSANVNQYAISVINLDADSFDTYQFVFSTTINDVASYFDGTNTDIFLATNTGTYTANFNNLTPVFNKLYYNYSYSGSNLYSYNSHQVNKINLSDISSSDEGYILINNYPYSGSQIVGTINSEKILYTGSNLNIFSIGQTGGISDNGIVIGDNHNMYITSAPITYSGSVLFPYTYGSNLQIGGNNVVNCYTSTLSSLNTFVSAPLSSLDSQTITAGQYLLVRQQPNNNQNGIYLVSSITGSTFTATQQTLSNLAVGNYVLVANGQKHANSYWEISPTSNISTNNIVFRLRSTNLGSGLGSTTKIFTDLNNSICLTSSGSILSVYDSTNITYDVYKHQATGSFTNNQILSAESLSNTIITSKAILSENLAGPNQGMMSYIDYTYPLIQGGLIYVKNATTSWLLNQLIIINFNGNLITGCVLGITGNNYTIQIVSSPEASLGQSNISTKNLTFNNLIQNNNFQQLWYNGLFGVSSGSYLVALNSSQYSGSIFTDSITITDSNYYGSAIYGKLSINSNLLIDSVDSYDQNNNTLVTNYTPNTIVSEFNQTTSSPYILDHNTGYKTLSLENPIFIDESNSAIVDNVEEYVGIASTVSGDQYISISDNEISPTTFPTDSVIYESLTKASNSIENKLFGNNQFSSQTLSNNVILNNNLQSALNNFVNSTTSATYEDIIVDSGIPSTYEPLISDFNAGVSNYTYDSWLGIADESVHTLFSLNNQLYAVIQGKIIQVGSPSVVMVKTTFNYCYFALTNSSYLILGTDHGLYVYDLNFNLLFKTLLDHKVKTAMFISSNQLLIGVENNVCYVNLSNFSSDFVSLPVNTVNAINQINNNTETIYLIGTDQGLYSLTLNAMSSNQNLIIGLGIIGAKQISLSTESIVLPSTANQNSILGIYDSLSTEMPAEYLLDSVGQPNISDIAVNNSSVFIATENGIDLYENLFTIDMQTLGLTNQSFVITSQQLSGFSVNKLINFYDATSKIQAYFVSTFDGVYYSFDNLSTFIKSSMTYPAFAAIATGSHWNLATAIGLYQTSNYGNTYSSATVARGTLLNSNQNVDLIIQMNNDMVMSAVNVPVYATTGSYSLNLILSATNYLTGEPISTLATATFSTGSLLNGYCVLPFNLNTAVSLKKDLTYNVTINTLSSTDNLYIGDQNYSSPAFSVLSCKVTGSVSNNLPAIKLCEPGINSNTYINQQILSNQLMNTSNILIDNNNNIYSYPTAEVNFIIDDSLSFVNQFGTSNINNFITTLQNQFAAKIGNYCYFNTIFTDDSLTGFNNVSTGSAALLSTGSSLSRIIDALCVTMVRNNSTNYASSTISSGSYAAYINGVLSNNAGPFVLKNILKASNNPNLNIQYNYNTPLVNSTTYNITQSGFTGSITGSPYVIIDNAYASTSDYTLNNYFDYTGVAITGKKVSDVQIFTSTGSPALSTISSLNTFGQYFSSPWSQWLASQQSKIIVLLSDNIDNDSVESISDYITLFENTNTLLILCSLSTENGNLYTALSENIISIGKLSTESVSAYISRVNTFVNNLTHKTFGGTFDILLDNTVTNLSITFSGLNVFGIMRDLESGNIIKNFTFTSGQNITTTDTNQQKRITVFYSGAGSITNINAVYVYASQFLYSRTLMSGSSYNNEIVFGNITKGIGNSKSNIYPISGSNSITQLSSGFSTSPHGTPFWTKESADFSSFSPISFSGSSTEIPSNISGYRKFYVKGPSVYTRIPISANSTLNSGSNSWFDWKNNFIYSTTTGSISNINSSISNALIYRYPYNDYNSIQNSMVPYDILASYARNNRSLIFDSTRQFKLFKNIETYNNSLNYSSKINLYLSGNIPNNSIENKFIKYTYNLVNVTYKPTISVLPSTNIPIFTKYQDSNVTIYGYSTNLSTPGRKPVTITNSNWTVSGSQINTFALYTGATSYLNSVSYNLNNTIGESTGSSLTSFSADFNYTPIIVSASTLVNLIPSNTAGVNDIITLSTLIDRKDGTANSEYIYQYNVGDQISVTVNWYGVSKTGAPPTLIASGNSLTINSTYVTNYSYVFAKLKATRSFTQGSTVDCLPIFLS